jgi:hypothetical protein
MAVNAARTPVEPIGVAQEVSPRFGSPVGDGIGLLPDPLLRHEHAPRDCCRLRTHFTTPSPGLSGEGHLLKWRRIEEALTLPSPIGMGEGSQATSPTTDVRAFDERIQKLIFQIDGLIQTVEELTPLPLSKLEHGRAVVLDSRSPPRLAAEQVLDAMVGAHVRNQPPVAPSEGASALPTFQALEDAAVGDRRPFAPAAADEQTSFDTGSEMPESVDRPNLARVNR